MPPNARHGKGIPWCPSHWEGLGHTVRCLQAGMSGGTPCYSILSSSLPPRLGCLPPLRVPPDHSPRASSFEWSSSSSSPKEGRLAFSSDPQTSCSRFSSAPAFFIPMTLGCHWSTFHDPIRTSCLLIGQLFPIQIRTSCLPIGQVSLFKELPSSLDRHSQSNAPRHRHDRRTRCGCLGTTDWSWSCGVHRGAKGTDDLVERLGKQFGMQVEVLVPPNHPRATFITPSTVEVLMLANPHLHQAAEKLGKQMPSHVYTLQLLQRNYQLAKKAHTIYAFGILEQDHKRVKGGTGWTVQLANPSISLTFPVNHGTARTITTKSMRMPPPWSLAVNLSLGDLKSPPFIKAVPSWDPGMWTKKPEPKLKPCSTAPSVSPRTLINYVWNWKTFICNVLVFTF